MKQESVAEDSDRGDSIVVRTYYGHLLRTANVAKERSGARSRIQVSRLRTFSRHGAGENTYALGSVAVSFSLAFGCTWCWWRW